MGGIPWKSARAGSGKRFARRLASPASQARYEHKRDTLIAVRRILQAIEEERERQQLSKAELASIAGMPPAAVRRLLTAEGSNPTLRTVVSVADALGFEIELKPASTPAPNAVSSRGSRRRRAISTG